MGVYNTIEHGQDSVSTAGTNEPLNGGTTISTAANGELAIRADSGNAGNIYVGDSDVDSTNGFVLAAGESVSLPVADVADVHIDADNNGEGVSWIVEAAN